MEEEKKSPSPQLGEKSIIEIQANDVNSDSDDREKLALLIGKKAEDDNIAAADAIEFVYGKLLALSSEESLEIYNTYNTYCPIYHK